MRSSGEPPFWEAGTQILWRYELRAPDWSSPEGARPVTVVRDDAEGLVAWLAPGTPVLRPVLADGRDLRAVPRTEMFRPGRALQRDLWREPGVLKIAPTGAPWAVFIFWNADWRLRGWYVNLEAPHRRDERGVVTEDHVLDLVVSPDRSIRWKDEDELDAAVAAGRYRARDAERFRDDARAVEEIVGAWRSPFCDGWDAWRPDPAWPIPQLPADAAWDYG